MLFSVINTTQTFGHLYCTNFEHFKNKRHDSVCTCINRWKISEFLCRGFTGPKTTQNGYFWGGVCECDMGIAQTAQFPAVGIISGTSRHPKDVPFMVEFWWLMYSLGAISPRKRRISLITAIDVLLSHDAKVNKWMRAWHTVRGCFSK